MDDPLPQSPYKTLGVPKDATLATIRSAHRKLVLSCHPDKVQDPAAKIVKAEEFHQVQQAYEILSDERRRQRYDEKIKLDELRAEMEEERRPAPRRTPDYTPRPAPPPRYESTYAAQGYEPERNRYNSRPYEEDAFAARFAEERPSIRKSDSYAVPPARKVSGRGFEERERRKSRDVEEDREVRDRRKRESEKAREMYEREQRDRKRDKERRKGTEAKLRSKHTYAEDDEESGSELDDRYYKSVRDLPQKARYEERYEDTRRGSREEVPRKNSKRDQRGYDDELTTKEMNVHDYISRSREAIDLESRQTESRRPARARTVSTAAVMTPPPPPLAPVDSGKRSSGRGARAVRDSRNPSPVRSSKKDKRMPEIVESPSTRKPSLPKASSESKGLRGIFSPSSTASRRPPQRAATYQPTPEFKPGPMRRSETMPVDQMHRGDTKPLYTSNLKNMKAPSEYSSDSDTDSDSMMTDEMPIRPPPPRQNKTSYKYVQDEEKLVEEIHPPRKSDEMPRVRPGAERPSMASRAVTSKPSPNTTPRTASYAFPQDEHASRPSPSRNESTRAPPLPRHPSSRPSPRLYGEYSSDEKPYKSRASPKIFTDNDHITQSPRNSKDMDRDAWPGSFRSRPKMSRNETAAY